MSHPFLLSSTPCHHSNTCLNSTVQCSFRRKFLSEVFLMSLLSRSTPEDTHPLQHSVQIFHVCISYRSVFSTQLVNLSQEQCVCQEHTNQLFCFLLNLFCCYQHMPVHAAAPHKPQASFCSHQGFPSPRSPVSSAPYPSSKRQGSTRISKSPSTTVCFMSAHRRGKHCVPIGSWQQ